MKRMSSRFAALLLGFALTGAPAALAGAEESTIAPGYDLFETVEGTSFGLRLSDLGVQPPRGADTTVQFKGVPIGRYDFPATGGVETGATDTIVERLEAGGEGSKIPMRLAAMQLVSTNTAVPFYVTLDPNAPSTGTIRPTKVGSDGGSFTADLTVNYLVRALSPTGPVVLANTVTFDSVSEFQRVPGPDLTTVTKVAMTHIHRVRPVLLPLEGVNFRLNGSDTSSDFFPGTPA